MTYVNRKQTGANGVLLTTANGSYPISCPEDITTALPPKAAPELTPAQLDFIAQDKANRQWFFDSNAQLEADWLADKVTRDEYWQRFNAIQAEYMARGMAHYTAWCLWWITQDVPECKRVEQAETRRRLVARGLVSADGAKVSEPLDTPHEPQQLNLFDLEEAG